ncbi:MAG: hypothetical protein IPK53_18955 [bacterium]|nr:hypothetical protein [bacterium]
MSTSAWVSLGAVAVLIAIIRLALRREGPEPRRRERGTDPDGTPYFPDSHDSDSSDPANDDGDGGDGDGGDGDGGGGDGGDGDGGD